MPEVSLKQYEQVMSVVYDAATEPDKWQDFCDQLNNVSPGSGIALVGHDTREFKSTGAVTSGFDPADAASFFEHYHLVNPWRIKFADNAIHPIGVAVTSNTVLTKNQLFRTEFYGDWLRLQENRTRTASVVVDRQADKMVFLSANIRAKDGKETEDKLASLFTMMAPHMQKALFIQRALKTSSYASDSKSMMLNTIKNPLVALDKDCRILHMNQAAEAELQGYFSIDASGQISAKSKPANLSVQRSIKAIVERRFQDVDGVFALTAPGNLNPIFASISPMRRSNSRSLFLDDYLDLPSPVALLTITSPTLPVQQLTHILKSSFGLTPAETRLAMSIYDGVSTGDFANKHKLSKNTIKTQLKAIFSKTNTNKQSELVAYLNRLWRV